MVEQLLNQEKLFELARSDCPESVLRHPGMIDQSERRALFNLTKSFWRYGSVIVDAGAFLGASTKAFLEGLEKVDLRDKGNAIYTFEYARFSEYSAKFATESLKRSFCEGEDFSNLLKSLVNDKNGVVKYFLGDVRDHSPTIPSISILFLDILKDPGLQTAVYSKFFPSCSTGTILYQQDYFHPYHPWIAYSMAKNADAIRYVGRPNADGDAFNAAIFEIVHPEKLLISQENESTPTKEEVLDYMNKAVDMHDSPAEKLNIVGLKCAAIVLFEKQNIHPTSCIQAELRNQNLDFFLDDSSQKHHINRIFRIVEMMSKNSLQWK